MRRAFVAGTAAAAVAVTIAGLASSAGAKVLRVGSYKRITGQFSSIQAAINAAKPGDWILVGPGDYKTSSSRTPAGRPDLASALIMSKRDVYLRGMNRNTVVVDGTKPGSPRCSRKAADQNFGPASSKGPKGLNGILIWKAADVWVQNLTVCNFLGGSADTGNEIWWNGNDTSGKIEGTGFYGSYMTTTSTFFKNEKTAAKYGIFSSNWTGGEWDHSYASNFNDSGFYIGACQQLCNQTISDAHAQFNALGYSGSNSGGQLVVKNSEFDQNETGFSTNSQNGDNPPPQNGACPGTKVSPITHTHSCWVFMHNYVHDNNNPNVPSSGSAAAGPVGTGMSVAGARNDTIMNNRFVNNAAWGVIIVPYSDAGPPCTGGTLNSPFLGTGGCLYDEYGDALINNKFGHNGFYGNPTNGDFGQLNFEHHATNCFSGNMDPGGSLTSGSATLQQSYPACSGATVSPNINVPFLNEVLCDSQVTITGFGCKPGDHYPRRTQVIMHALPKNLPTMPKVCAGVPANPWCPGRKH
jgi:hypothetical protein